MRAWRLVAIGAVLPLVIGATLGSITADAGKDTWAYPIHPTAFLLMSVGLAISHALVLVGYLEVSRRSEGLGAALAKVGAAGTAMVTACELWSGLVAETDLDSPMLTALDTGYVISSVVIALGTVGSGLALRQAGSRFAAPLLANGLFLVVAVAVRYFGSDGLGIAALTGWSLLYLWLAMRIRSAASARVVSIAERQAVT